ncbi:MAG: glycoside hydrolase family 31 protein, partial [Saprospiraceae bacterium]
NGQLFTFGCENGVTLRVEVMTDKIIRFRYAHNGRFERDFSYAVDPKFAAQNVPVDLHVTTDFYEIKTAEVQCKINKSNLGVQLLDKNGAVMLEDAAGFYAYWTILEGVSEVKMSKKAQVGEQFFGLGDKSCDQNMHGKQFENWCTDSFAYGKDTDPLYRAVPFYYGLHDKRAYGIFFDNTYKTAFDFAKTETDTVSFSAPGGEINFYYIHGPELLEVAQQYTDLTGRPELPALWALGFHQCRWSYFPEKRVHEVADDFRKHQIPCDAIYLDIDYMDGYRCFTWNNDHFPEPTQMIADLREKGFKTVVMIDPGIKEDPNYHVYQQMMEKGYQCKRTNGETMLGPVWPQECVFPDFTRAEVREWWSGLYKELYVDNDIAGFWNDMNEPAVFKVTHKTFPDNVMHDYDGDLTDHRKAHNIYGQQMARSTYEGLKKLKPNHRPIVITRATFSGGQRYACAWTGDNVASWEHLRLANIQCQRMALSGFSHIGTDIGGFVEKPTPELMLRWLQLGIFHPFFRVHSMGNNVDGAGEADADAVEAAMKIDRMDQEPWSFGEEFTVLNRQAIELRYQLLPYLYTAFARYSSTGVPVLRNLTTYDQHDEQTYGRELEFIFGKHTLVRSIVEPMEVEKLEESEEQTKAEDTVIEAPIGGADCDIYLPKGNWFNYWTGKQVAGNQQITVQKQLDKLPIYIKAGAVIPHYPVMQYTNERPVDELTLKVYFSKEKTLSELYEDAGEGYDYESGIYSLKTFTTQGTDTSFTLAQTKKGEWKDTYGKVKVEVYGLPFKAQRVELDGKVVEFSAADGLSFTVQNEFSEIKIS